MYVYMCGINYVYMYGNMYVYTYVLAAVETVSYVLPTTRLFLPAVITIVLLK